MKNPCLDCAEGICQLPAGHSDEVDRSGFYGPTVKAEYDWHELVLRDPLAKQALMLQWGMPL